MSQSAVPPPRTPSATGEAGLLSIEFMRRVAEWECTETAPVHRQHMVSRALLDGWAVRDPKGTGRSVQPFRIADGLIHQLRPQNARNTGFQMDWVTFGSASLEQLWGKTEAKIPQIRAAVEARTLFDDPELVKAVGDLVALHYVRVRRQRDQFQHWLKQHRPSPDQSHSHIGQAAPEDDKLFRVAAEDLFEFARKRVGTGLVQIIVPAEPEDEFLISDAATLAVRHLHRTDKVDEFGVPLSEASCLFLPLGPRYIAAIGNETGYWPAPSRAVRGLNTQQAANRDEMVFTRPGSPLQKFLSAHRSSSGPRLQEPTAATATT